MHQTAIFLMLISKKIISLAKIPFKVDKKWFASIQKRLDLIATQSLFKEEPAIMLSNGYKIYVNGDFVTYEWTGDFAGKKTKDLSNVIVVVVNLDPHYTQSGWVDLPPSLLGISAEQPFQMHDLLSNARYLWNGSKNYVELNPHICPAHVFLVRKKIRDERDFDYYI